MSPRTVVLLSVTIITDDLPLPDHTQRCGVCFCGKSFQWGRCKECGYVAPLYRNPVVLAGLEELEEFDVLEDPLVVPWHPPRRRGDHV